MNDNDEDPTLLPSPPSSARQKRPLRELSGGTDDVDDPNQERLSVEDDNDDVAVEFQHGPNPSNRKRPSVASFEMPPTSFQRLRLEAIFYPKFDNEKQQQHQQLQDTTATASDDIRQQMKQKISQQRGYLEVTLKHSGSLLLWSGGSRYYSKNSTDNVFTLVGEIIVRQHFHRAWYCANTEDPKEALDGDKMYKQCSDYLEQHRLTLAMELVTAVLGDHGAVPHRDFIIITALADRNHYHRIEGNELEQLLLPQSWFATTPELLQFCQRFRLPHNDVWMLTSLSSVNRMLDAHDQWRENGTATTVIPAITEVADIHVASMYPHDVFQGDILEGMVVRYVPYSGCQLMEAEPTGLIERMHSLATGAEEIRQRLVPATRPPSHELPPPVHNTNTMASINLRLVFDQCRGKYPDGLTRLEQALRSILSSAANDAMRDDDDDGADELATIQRRVERLPKNVRSNFPVWVEPLLESPHEETKQIAKLIHRLHSLTSQVDYHVWREFHPRLPLSSRWLCMIHVLHDTTFVKYRKNMDKDDMELFRGFCLEFGDWDDNDVPTSDHHISKPVSVCSSAADMELVDDDESTNTGALMLKMKLLPYMVRTFACRNGLRIIKQSGAGPFQRFCVDLLNKWQVSDEAKQKWLPFFQAWGEYASDCFHQQSQPSTSLGSPLSESFYLDHLERFSALYESGAFTQIASSPDEIAFRGLVVVVALDTERAHTVSKYLAKELGGLKVVFDVNSVAPDDALLARTSGSGFVCGTLVTHGVKKLQKLLKDHGAFISIVLFGCDEASITDLNAAEKEKKKMKGIMNQWRALNHANTVELNESSLRVLDGDEPKYVASNAFADLVEHLLASTKALPGDDATRGLVIFFPGIPGCGKSTICSEDTASMIRSKITQCAVDQNDRGGELVPAPTGRNVLVRSGDAVKQHYWQLAQAERAKDVSCVYIADKNSPPWWETIGKLCAKTKAVAVPVIPDKAALQTTVVRGMIQPDGTPVPNVTHVYPFSLSYLAVCMLRVLDRGEGSHQGRLDRGTKFACWIVLQFFAFYRGITADRFLGMMQDQLESNGALTIQSAIELPFFRDETPPSLPHDLEQVLHEALQIQVRTKTNVRSKHKLRNILTFQHSNSTVESQRISNQMMKLPMQWKTVFEPH